MQTEQEIGYRCSLSRVRTYRRMQALIQGQLHVKDAKEDSAPAECMTTSINEYLDTLRHVFQADITMESLVQNNLASNPSESILGLGS